MAAAKAQAPVAVPQTEEAVKAVEELTNEQQMILEATLIPFDYDFLEPFVRQAAKLLGLYDKELANAGVPTEVRHNVVYDFHRKLWGMDLEEGE